MNIIVNISDREKNVEEHHHTVRLTIRSVLGALICA